MTTTPSTDPVDVLSEEQCWDALASADLGRLAVRAGDDIDIYPVNYLVKDRQLYFRTAPGTKMIELTRMPRVAFEVDGVRAHRLWSVVIKGVAHRLAFDSEIEASGIHNLHSLDPATKWNYVRITPHAVTGRRFDPAP